MYKVKYSLQRSLNLGGYCNQWAMEGASLSLSPYVYIYSYDRVIILYEQPQSEGLLETFIPEKNTERAFLEKQNNCPKSRQSRDEIL